MIAAMLVMTVLLISAQEAQQQEDKSPPRAEILKNRVHDLRRRLLVGGENVRHGESEAVSFYESRIEKIDKRTDSIQADLAEKGARYDAALKRTLAVETEDARRTAATDAALLRGQIMSLQNEKHELLARRIRFVKAIDLVQARADERDRLATRMETTTEVEGPGIPYPAVGLAPEVDPKVDPLLFDEGLVEDLLRVDPLRARQLLFDLDPDRYWTRWPLHPPTDALLAALPFPLPDLPGER